MKVLQIMILIAGLSILANAQNTILTGTVYAENGARITRVKIQIVDSTAKVYETKTDTEGRYEINLPLGIHKIKFSTNSDFKPVMLEKYRVVNTDTKEMFFDIVMEQGEAEVIID